MRSASLVVVFLLLNSGAVTGAAGAATCTSASGGSYENDGVNPAAGSSTWSCGVPSADDDLVIQHAITFEDLDADGLIEVTQTSISCDAAGGSLSIDGRADIVTGSFIMGPACDDVTLRGRFRGSTPGDPGPKQSPEAFQLGRYEPCGFDPTCTTGDELASWSYDGAAVHPSSLLAAWDPETATPISDPDDWVCMWDFDEDDSYVPADMGFCYPLAEVDTDAPTGLGTHGFSIDVRQGYEYGRCDDGGGAATAGDGMIDIADEDVVCRPGGGQCTYSCIPTVSHALRTLKTGHLADAAAAGSGCGYVYDPARGALSRGRSGLCGGLSLRLDALTSPIQRNAQHVGRWIRFSNAITGEPEEPAYKIVQSLDCAGAPAAPHACAGAEDDILTIGDPAGLVASQPAGAPYWIDNGWHQGDPFFVMAPVAIRNTGTTPGANTQVRMAAKQVSVRGVVFDGWGSNSASGEPAQVNAQLVVGDGTGGTNLVEWRHVILRNDIGLYAENSGKGLVPFGLDGLIDHTAIHGQTGHCMLGFSGSIDVHLELRHQFYDGCGDGPTNWHTSPNELDLLVKRSHFRSTDPLAASANLAAFLGNDTSETEFEEILCDDCVQEMDSSQTIPAFTNFGGPGFALRDSGIWGINGRLGEIHDLENVFILGLRDESPLGTKQAAARTIGEDARFDGLAMGMVTHDTNGSWGLDVVAGTHVSGSFLFDWLHRNIGSSFVRVFEHSTFENFAIVNVENANSACASEFSHCRILADAKNHGDGAVSRDGTITWTDARETGHQRLITVRDTSGAPGPILRRVLVTHHAFDAGVGEASFLSASIVNDTRANGGDVRDLCFFGNETDNTFPTTADDVYLTRGIDPGFLDPARYEFATSSTSHEGCGFIEEEPPGLKRDSWATRKVKIPFQRLTASAAHFGTACDDGLDNDGDGLIDAAGGDPGCFDDTDISERDPLLPCDDGVDNDGDHWIDYVADVDGDGLSDLPGDPVCLNPSFPRETARCQDGLNNDGQPGTDFDGGVSVLGVAGADPQGADPDCVGRPSRDHESHDACGVGGGLILIPAVLTLAARRRRRREASQASDSFASAVSRAQR